MPTKKRIEQFVIYPPGFVLGRPLFPKILNSARHLLKLAAVEDQGNVDPRIHDFTTHGPAAITLVVTALDLWLSNVALALMKDTKDMQWLLAKNLPGRYRELYARAQTGKAPDIADLEIVVEVRHEITHHFQRPSSRHLPEWMPTLETRKLVPVSEHVPEVDWFLTDKLSSYALAYWVFGITERMVTSLLRNGKRGRLQMEDYAIAEFSAYHKDIGNLKPRPLRTLKQKG